MKLFQSYFCPLLLAAIVLASLSRVDAQERLKKITDSLRPFSQQKQERPKKEPLVGDGIIRGKLKESLEPIKDGLENLTTNGNGKILDSDFHDTLKEGVGRIEPEPHPKLHIRKYKTITRDGWDISIRRYYLKDPGPDGLKAAVILCHGFNINNLFWDIDKNTSLARHLALEGYDVWCPDLRGAGDSSKPFSSKLHDVAKLDPDNLKKVVPKDKEDFKRMNWTIDDHIRRDVPTIVNFVTGKSNFEQVYWIGHSMGGIIMYAHLIRTADPKIAGFIPLGSMVIFPNPLTPELKKIAKQKQLLTASLIVNTAVGSQLTNYTFGAVKSPVEKALLERDNMNKKTMFRFFRTCIDDTSPGVVGQFSDSIRDRKIQSKDGSYNYTGNIGKVDVPIYLMVGSADGFVNEYMIRACYDAVSSEDKELIIFSKANGYTTNYGHCDLIIGKNSRKEFYPAIVEWLDARTVPLPVPLGPDGLPLPEGEAAAATGTEGVASTTPAPSAASISPPPAVAVPVATPSGSTKAQ